MKKYKIALLPSDGVGKEVVAEGVNLLNCIADLCQEFVFDYTEFP